MNSAIGFDAADVDRFRKSLDILGGKTTLKAARKAARLGSNVVGKAIRLNTPKGKTGNLKHGFKKKSEKTRIKGKFGYQYAMDPGKNAIFQKPVVKVGKYGGKRSIAYYPSSVEYGFMTSAGKSGGYKFIAGKASGVKHIDGTHFTRDAAENARPAAFSTMTRVLNEELDKEWAKI